MALSDGLLAQFDYEMAGTRKTLERVPEGKPDWAPHPKSMKMGRLAGHLAELPGLALRVANQDSHDFRPGDPARKPLVMSSRQELLEIFDKNVAAAREAIAAVSDEAMLKPWTLMVGGKTLFSMPRLAVFRSMLVSHMIHHRAQLGVYLRMNDVPVPSLYGPSADESPV